MPLLARDNIEGSAPIIPHQGSLEPCTLRRSPLRRDNDGALLAREAAPTEGRLIKASLAQKAHSEITKPLYTPSNPLE